MQRRVMHSRVTGRGGGEGGKLVAHGRALNMDPATSLCLASSASPVLRSFAPSLDLAHQSPNIPTHRPPSGPCPGRRLYGRMGHAAFQRGCCSSVQGAPLKKYLLNEENRRSKGGQVEEDHGARMLQEGAQAGGASLQHVPVWFRS